MSRTVDLHHHVIPDFYWEASNEDGNAAGGITPPRWSVDGAIAYLDDAGIDAAVPSISTPGVHFGDGAAGRILARRVNEFRADSRRDRPDRFGAFAALPLPDVEGSLEQIAYAFDVLELDGVSINSTTAYVRPNTRRQVRVLTCRRHDSVRRLTLLDRRSAAPAAYLRARRRRTPRRPG